MKLKNKVAIVTGAGSGNGRAIALRLFEEGATVVVADLNEAGANETISLAPEGSKAMVVKVDVTQKDQVDNMVAQTVQEFGKVDILVNNAGIVAFTPFLELDVKEWDKVHDVNLKAPFLCSQAVAKEMIKAGQGGRIINITSVEAHRVVSSSGHCQPHYNSSKGGLHMLTKAIALELSSYGITCNAVAPGVIQTPFTEKGLAIPEVKEWVLERLPVGRIGQPQDVANAVLFLAQDDASYVTGSTLVVDGGWTIH
ncbi:SDR family NAD(P)-dependent oxidoreductase [Brevibacillus reuszeri]|uniref:SDR family NAD(P)-dependent oxidoreductase n=1 Tax=Brevibacillus TaxID=55080 RepID=UPI000CCC6630|nr:3-oxoacyl-ACP reductase family protein [Brevibacillus reuszeri]